MQYGRSRKSTFSFFRGSPRSQRSNYRRRSVGIDKGKRKMFLTGVVWGTSLLATSAAGYWLGNIFEPSNDKGNVLHSILIDSSDPVSEGQHLQIEALLKEEFVSGFSRGDRVLVASLNHEIYSPIDWFFDEVAPGQGKDANIIWETPQELEENWHKEFFSLYAQKLDKAREPVERPKTPLIAGLETLSLHASFQGGYDAPGLKNRKLLLVTDGLENAVISAYNGTLYGKKAQKYLNEHTAQFKDVEVIVALIRRPERYKIQNERHWEWLYKHLKACGASSVRRINVV